MTYAKIHGLQPADRVVETITHLGITTHHAIFLGADAQGLEWMAENYKFQGVRLINAQQYFERIKKIRRIVKFEGSPLERKQAVQRALDQLGRPYDLINFNCEHFAEQVQSGKPRSRQVETVAVGLLAILVIGLLTAD